MMRDHGCRSAYQGGCRCLPCRAANARYETDRHKGMKLGVTHLTDAQQARERIMEFSSIGIGRRTLSKACRVSPTTLAAILQKRRTTINKKTEQKILSCPKEGVVHGALVVDARPTQQLIAKMLRDGSCKVGISKRLGHRTGNYSFFKRAKITRRNALKVARLYKTIMA